MGVVYQLTLTVIVKLDSDDEARKELGELCDLLSEDNDFYENNTAIVTEDGRHVSIYSDDYPEHIKQNPDH